MNLKQLKKIIKESIKDIQTMNLKENTIDVLCHCDDYGNTCTGTLSGLTANCSCCDRIGNPPETPSDTTGGGMVKPSGTGSDRVDFRRR